MSWEQKVYLSKQYQTFITSGISSCGSWHEKRRRVRLSERALVVEVCGQTVPIFETNFEDLDLVDLWDEEKVVQRLQESLVHVPLLNQWTVLLQECAEEQSLRKNEKLFFF